MTNDFKKVEREDGGTGRKVSRRQLCVRVSTEASDALLQASREHQVTQQDMLTWMLIKGLPKYSSLNNRMDKLRPYIWPDELMKPDDRQVKYKGSTGTKQLNLGITSTAYYKLECHKTATGYSKARIIQTLILNYRFLTENEKEYNRWKAEREKQLRDEYREGYREVRNSPTPEEIQATKDELNAILNRQEEAWDEIFEEVRDTYEQKLSQNKE